MRAAILLVLVFLAIVPSASANKNLGAAGGHAAAPSGRSVPSTRSFPPRASAPRLCSAWKAIRFYSARYDHWMALSGHASPRVVSQPHGCAYARWVALRWKERAATARSSYEHSQRSLFRRLYEKWRCIHHNEGAWNSNTGNGYYGGLQMDWGFMRAYGSEFLARYGTADHWPVIAQLTAAERAYRVSGFSPWPNTRLMCGV